MEVQIRHKFSLLYFNSVNAKSYHPIPSYLELSRRVRTRRVLQTIRVISRIIPIMEIPVCLFVAPTFPCRSTQAWSEPFTADRNAWRSQSRPLLAADEILFGRSRTQSRTHSNENRDFILLFLFSLSLSLCSTHSFPHMCSVPLLSLEVFLPDRVSHLSVSSNDLESNDDAEHTGTHGTDYLPFVVSSGDYPRRGNYETGP